MISRNLGRGTASWNLSHSPSRCWLALVVLAFQGPIGFGAPAQSPAEASEHGERGASFAARNDLKAAEAEFRQAVKLSPNNLPYLANLGSILGMEHKLAESTLYLEKALKLDPNNGSIRRDLASDQWQMGHLEEANQNLRRVLAVKPGDPRTTLLLGMVSESLKDYPEAVRLLESVPTLAKEQPESIVALARAYYHLDLTERARQVLNELVDHPSGDRGLFVGAKAAADSEDFDTAERLFRSIRSAYPDPSTLGYQLAFVQFRAGRFDQSQSTLGNLLATGHQGDDTSSLLALCYYKQGKEEEATRTMDELMERIPRTEADFLKVGNMLLNNDLPVAAYKVAKNAVEIAPDSAKPYGLKGTVELALYDYEDAIQSFSRALQLDPSSAEADLGLALGQWGAGKIPEAVRTFEEGLKRFPRDTRHYTKYAQFLIEGGERKGDTDMESRAVALLERAISLDPTNADAHYEVGNFLLSKKKPQEALTELETAARLDPTESSTRYALTRAFRRLGRNEEAAKQARLFDELQSRAHNKP